MEREMKERKVLICVVHSIGGHCMNFDIVTTGETLVRIVNKNKHDGSPTLNL
jgi:hypothetical protein